MSLFEQNKEFVERFPPGVRGFYESDFILSRSFIEMIAHRIDLRKIETVLDVGTRDCYQSLEFATYFPDAMIYAFEANPECVPKCLEVTKDEDRIVVVPKAVHNYVGTVKFFPIDLARSPSKNVGASSLSRVRSDYRREAFVQKEIEVPCTTIDAFLDGKPADLLWMDVQGAELLVLQGMRETLKSVKAVCLECGVKPWYEEHSLKPEIDQFMEEAGFEDIHFHLNFEYEGDTFYVNKKFAE